MFDEHQKVRYGGFQRQGMPRMETKLGCELGTDRGEATAHAEKAGL